MNKKIDAKFFRIVKLMLKDGETIKGTADYFKIGEATVSRIKAAETYEEYLNIMAAMYAKKKAAKEQKATVEPEVKPQEPQESPVQVVEHRQSVTVHATHYMECELKKQTEILELISRKLSFIVDQLS